MGFTFSKRITRLYITKLTLVTNSRRSGNCCRITWFVYFEANFKLWGEVAKLEKKGGEVNHHHYRHQVP